MGTAVLGLKAFGQTELVMFKIQKILEERRKLAENLRATPAVHQVYPSAANFLLFEFALAKQVYLTLVGRGVVTRWRRNEPLCEDCLRVTIGMPDENRRFLKELNSVLETM